MQPVSWSSELCSFVAGEFACYLTYILIITLNLSGVYSSKRYLDMKIRYKYINSYFTPRNLTNCPFSQFKCHFY